MCSSFLTTPHFPHVAVGVDEIASHESVGGKPSWRNGEHDSICPVGQMKIRYHEASGKDDFGTRLSRILVFGSSDIRCTYHRPLTMSVSSVHRSAHDFAFW